jgi:hypothetical protein
LERERLIRKTICLLVVSLMVTTSLAGFSSLLSKTNNPQKTLVHEQNETVITSRQIHNPAPLPMDENFTYKWKCDWGYTSYSTIVTKDVNDDNIDEIFVGGYNASRTPQSAICSINGSTGEIIWEHTITTLSSYHVSPVIADLNNDGKYEVITCAGTNTIAYNAANGTIFWNVSVCSAWNIPVVVDTDGNGYPYVYVASNTVFTPDKISKLYGRNGTIAKQASCNYVCYGGISAADINNDGKVEIVMNDMKTKCYDENLTLLWTGSARCESSRPCLINVTGDSKLEIVMGRLGATGNGGLCVYYANGTVVPGMNTSNLGMHVHTQPTTYINHVDGHVKITFGSDSRSEIFDITDWTLDCILPETAPEPPNVYQLYPGSGMQFLDPGDDSNKSSNIYNITTYDLIETIYGGWGANTILQDIDGDGYNELLFNCCLNGSIVAFDTMTPVPNQRLRSDVPHYGEYAQKAGVFCPYPLPTCYTQQSPSDHATVNTSLSLWKTYIKDYNKVPFNYTIQTSPNVGNASGSGVCDGNYSVALSNLSGSKTYIVFVNSTDRYGFMNKKFTFTTQILGNIHIKNLRFKWNFLSLPFNQSVEKTNLLVIDNNSEYSWQEAVNNGIIIDFIYEWNRNSQDYEMTDTLIPGHGYWIYAYEDCELLASKVGNLKSDSLITNLLREWNIIGLPSDEPVEKQNLTILYNGTMYSWQEAVTDTIIIDFIYQWNEIDQNYQLTDILHPGKSYWIYAYNNCTLFRPAS